MDTILCRRRTEGKAARWPEAEPGGFSLREQYICPDPTIRIPSLTAVVPPSYMSDSPQVKRGGKVDLGTIRGGVGDR